MREDLEIQESNIEIISGPQILERLSKEQIRRFSDILSQHNFDAPPIPAQKIRMRVRETLDTSIGSHLGKHFQTALDHLHPAKTRNQESQETFEELIKNIAEGNAFILLINGEPAATASLQKYRFKLKDGRELYEVAKAVTFPEFEGKKLGGRIMKVAFDAIREKYPDAPVMLITKNEKMKRKYRKLGWKELDIRELNATFNRLEQQRAQGMTDDERVKRDAGWDRYGYRLFLFDPANPLP